MMKTLMITVKGKVQGVTYRETTRRKATTLGLSGTVENLPGGDVRIIVTGEAPVLEELVAWCYKGPQLASVSEVISVEVPVQNFKDFTIKR